VNDRLVDGTAGRAEARKFGVVAVALQDVAHRHRRASDLIGDGALDDRPVHPAGFAFTFALDILEPAVDDGIHRIKLALDPPLRRISAAAAPITAAPIAASVTSGVAVAPPRPSVAFAPRSARLG